MAGLQGSLRILAAGLEHKRGTETEELELSFGQETLPLMTSAWSSPGSSFVLSLPFSPALSFSLLLPEEFSSCSFDFPSPTISSTIISFIYVQLLYGISCSVFWELGDDP